MDKPDLGPLIEEARLMTVDTTEEVEKILQLGREKPLPGDEARRMLRCVVTTMIAGARRRGDTNLMDTLPKSDGEIDVMIDSMIRGKR